MNALRHRGSFTLLLILFAAAILAMTPGLGRAARLVPVWVALPTLALLLVQLALDLSPALRRRCRSLASGTRPPMERRGGATDREAPRHAGPDRRTSVRLLWVLLLPLAIYLLGFLVAVPLHAFFCLRRVWGEGWGPSLATPAALGALLLLIARFVPEIPLWGGWLWIRWGVL